MVFFAAFFAAFLTIGFLAADIGFLYPDFFIFNPRLNRGNKHFDIHICGIRVCCNVCKII